MIRRGASRPPLAPWSPRSMPDSRWTADSGRGARSELAFARSRGEAADLDGTTAIDELLSGDIRRVMTCCAWPVCRASRQRNPGAIGDLLGIDDAARAIALFDRMSEDEVAEARAWLASPAIYRSAVEALGGNRG